MNSIPDLPQETLPQEIQRIIEASPEAASELWAWVSELHYAQVVGQAGIAHELVAIKQDFDWSAVEQVCQAFRLYAGKQGVEATHTLGQLCLGVVLKSYYNLSYAATAQKVRSDSLMRWFVGYRLDETSFSPVTLWRFDAWLKQHHPRLLFTQTLEQIDQDFPEETSAPQIGDTFAMRTRAHEQSRTELLRTCGQGLLTALKQVTPLPNPLLETDLNRTALFGAVGDKPEWALDKPQRDLLEVSTAVAAHQLLGQVQAVYATLPRSRDLLYLALTHRLSLLAKVLNDEFTFTLDEQGLCQQAVLRVKHEKGSYVIGSAIDPEATFRVHGERCDLGYNISVAATPRFIREIAAVTGATPDSKLVAPALEAQKSELGLVPPKFIYDRAAGTPKIYAEVEKASGGQTQLVARLINYGKASPRYGPQDCSLSEEGVLTCPAGKTSARSYRAQGGDGWHYRFLADECQGCPLWERCRGPLAPADPQPGLADAPSAAPSAAPTAVPKAQKQGRSGSKPTSHRTFFISDYAYQQRQALAYIQTPAFGQDMKLRPQIERIISCLVRYHGARHAAGYGVVNADYQARMAGMAFNLKSWVKLINERRRPKRTRAAPDPA